MAQLKDSLQTRTSMLPLAFDAGIVFMIMGYHSCCAIALNGMSVWGRCDCAFFGHGVDAGLFMVGWWLV
jgi:hypothetical protein